MNFGVSNVEQDWRHLMRGDALEWLLESDNPSVRYRTLLDLLDKTTDDPVVQETASQISRMPLVQYILGRRNRKGLWGDERDYYTPKHYSTFWTLSVLADLGVESDSHEMRTAIDNILSHQGDDGAFRRGQTTTKRPEIHGNPCTQARILRFLTQFGYAGHPAVQAGMDWLMANQRDDGSWICRSREKARYGCLRATHDFLRLAAYFPVYRRLSATRDAAVWLLDRLLDARTGRFHVANRWLTFTFPIFEYHLLSVVNALACFGFGSENERMVQAAKVILDKQTEEGVWLLDVEPQRAPANFGRAGQPNKWVTLDALRAIKRINQRQVLETSLR